MFVILPCTFLYNMLFSQKTPQNTTPYRSVLSRFQVCEFSIDIPTHCVVSLHDMMMGESCQMEESTYHACIFFNIAS